MAGTGGYDLAGPADRGTVLPPRHRVPGNWYPLLPKQTGLRAIEYQPGEAHLDPNRRPRRPAPCSAGTFGEEELYRPGPRVRWPARRDRWSDGSVRVWLGRRTGPERGESGNGLRFDSVDGSVAGDRQGLVHIIAGIQ